MTVSVSASVPARVTAYHATVNGVSGISFKFVGPTTDLFLTDADADALGRYLLFDKGDISE